jgi:CubicO group peptidase (beta-lactamase class C family)
MTTAFVVTWKGRLIAERYGDGINIRTPLEGWSMGKSITATLFGILLNGGAYNLAQPAPIPEWKTPGDARAKIRIEDLLHMSSGLRIRAPQDPDYDPSGPYPDHLYLYTGGVDSYHYAATRPQQWPPNTVGRYRNTDPVRISYLIRLAVKKSGEEYLSFPQRALFDKLGIRTMRIETDPFGNFLGQGLRGRVRPRFGAARQSLCPGWCLERRTPSARGLCEIRQHTSASLGSRQTPNLRRIFLDQRARPVSRPTRVLLHGGCWRADNDDRAIP